MDELLDASGARIAALCGCPAARVVPGASAGIALALGACVARGYGRGDGGAAAASTRCVLMQRGHEYKYARCARWRGRGWSGWTTSRPRCASRPAAVLHPAHLDARGAAAGRCVAPLARAAGVPVVVDAAYQSFPLSELARWSRAGDVACFSAKYFCGPNAGGFVAGAAALVADVAALDFVGYESGPWRTFGRAFKLDRSTVVATVVALEEWMAIDHEARLGRVRGVGAGARGALRRASGSARSRCRTFTFEERAGGRRAGQRRAGARRRGRSRARSPRGDPSVRAMATDDALVFCTEALTDERSR